MPLPTDELVRKANTTTTQLSALINKVWAARIEKNLRSSAVFQQSLTVFTELMAPNSGDTLYIPTLPDLGAATALTEDTDMTETALSNATSVALVPTEYGKAVAVRRKALDRIAYDGIAEVIDRLTYSMTQLIESTIANLYNAAVPIVGGSMTAFYPNGHATGTIVSTDILTGATVRNGKKLLMDANVPTWDDGYYHLYMAPKQWEDLYNDTDVHTDLRYAAPGEALMNGEVGRLYGVKLISSNFTAISNEGVGNAVPVYNCMMVAPRWACVAWKREPGVIVDPTIYDYGRKRKFGVFSDMDIELLHNERGVVLKSA